MVHEPLRHVSEHPGPQPFRVAGRCEAADLVVELGEDPYVLGVVDRKRGERRAAHRVLLPPEVRRRVVAQRREAREGGSGVASSRVERVDGVRDRVQEPSFLAVVGVHEIERNLRDGVEVDKRHVSLRCRPDYRRTAVVGT